MYKIVNDDWQQSNPETFGTFTEAFNFYTANTDGLSNIYYITESENTKVWDPRWSNISVDLETTLETIYQTIEEITSGK